MSERYDVVVVGAGIHGAGVAQAAAAAGYTVLVLEQTAVAAGTSSRSSKLIHGGLRYLESGRLRLVRESLRERELLLRLAPTLVRRIAFHIPVYKHSTRSALTIRAGLSLYALLGGLSRETRFARVPAAEWAGLDGLSTEGLKAVYRYHDAQTDDAELTRAVMRSAVGLGARLECPATFVAATVSAREVATDYTVAGAARQCVARVLVNAAGPWVNTVLAALRPAPRPLSIELVQGAHIVVGGHLTHGAYYVEAHDRRPVFVLPHGARTLVGTTETRHIGPPETTAPQPEEIAYLQQTLTRYFPGADAHVLAAFAGVRVLPHANGAYAKRARETALYVDPALARVLSIYGGKLTGYRATAEKAMHRLNSLLPGRTPRAKTARLMLS